MEKVQLLVDESRVLNPFFSISYVCIDGHSFKKLCSEKHCVYDRLRFYLYI